MPEKRSGSQWPEKLIPLMFQSAQGLSFLKRSGSGGKELKIPTKGDVYGRMWDKDSYETALDATLEREYQKNLILQAIKAGATAPRTIREKIGLDLKRISYLIADMEKTNMVAFTGMEDRIPVFAAL